MLAISAPASAHPHHHQSCSQFIKRVWNPSRWQRGQPKDSTIEAFRGSSCSRRAWRKAQKRFYEHRSQMLWLEEFKPFVYPDGTHWAVPYPIAWCESGGDYFVGPFGAYGLIFEAQWLPPKVQDEIAYGLYQSYGESPWAPYESGCAYR